MSLMGIRITRRRVIESSAGALPHEVYARCIGKYAGDCKTKTILRLKITEV